MGLVKLQQRQAGVTLVEMMIVIVIMGIMAGIAFPMMLRYYPNFQARGAARNMVANFQQAKIEAIRAGANAVIEITPGALADAGRVGNYRAFVDDGIGAGGIARNNIRDGAERLLFTVVMPDRVSLTGLAGFTAAADPGAAPGTMYTRYNSRGILPTVADAGVITLGSTTITYTITLTAAGHIRLGVL